MQQFITASAECTCCLHEQDALRDCFSQHKCFLCLKLSHNTNDFVVSSCLSHCFKSCSNVQEGAVMPEVLAVRLDELLFESDVCNAALLGAFQTYESRQLVHTPAGTNRVQLTICAVQQLQRQVQALKSEVDSTLF